MFCKIFLSPQVKRRLIITYKRCIYELFDELPNDLRLFPNHSSPWHSRHPGGLSHTRKKRLKDPRKPGNTKKVPKPHRMIAQRPHENPANTGRKLPKNRSYIPPAVRHPTRKPELAPNTPPTTA